MVTLLLFVRILFDNVDLHKENAFFTLTSRFTRKADAFTKVNDTRNNSKFKRVTLKSSTQISPTIFHQLKIGPTTVFIDNNIR